MLQLNSSKAVLNNDQQLAVASAKAFLKNRNTLGGVYVITGSPGTGKTFILKSILDGHRGSVIGATISHAAKIVLQNVLTEAIPCVTIAALFKLTQHITAEGDVIFTIPRDYYNQRRNYPSVIVLDEVSQIPDSIYDLILREAITYQFRIIAVGDPYQLPPVEQDHDSKFFNHIDSVLKQPMRFQGPISDLAAVYKTQIDHINKEEAFDPYALNALTHRQDKVVDGSGYSFTNSLDVITSMAAEDIKANMHDLLYARVLAYKNDSVAELNRILRRKIYGENLEQFEPSELVICNGGYAVSKSNSLTGYTQRVPVLYNGQLLKVAKHTTVTGPEEVPCLLVGFENFDNALGLPIYVVSNDPIARAAYDRIKSKLANEAKKPDTEVRKKQAWHRYYQYIESFAYLDYCYSANCHKSQGQTLTNIYVCEGEILGVKPLTWKQKFQSLYVSVTRAKQNLFIYNKDY